MYINILATPETTSILNNAGYRALDRDTYEKITSRYVPTGFVISASVNVEDKLYWFVHVNQYSPIHTDSHLRDIVLIRDVSLEAVQTYLDKVQEEYIDGRLHHTTTAN